MKELELYIHIPFCVKKCDYCDFLSYPSTNEERQAYVDALVREIESKKEWARDYRVTSIFFGGGTPSILEATQTEQIVLAIKDVFYITEDAEITTEMNPGTATKEKLSSYVNMGFNRLSIGLQSTRNEELRALGRIHTYEVFLQCYEDARAVGFENINIDLMSAIPGQTVESYQITLERVVALNPEHISDYSLIVEEGTPFFERYGEAATSDEKESGLPTEDEERLIYGNTKDYLHLHGYERYEISNYAKPRYECRHNLGYWECKEYLGLGLGASSLLDHKRLTNTRDMNSYRQGIYIEEEERLTKEMEMEEYCFLGLRKTKGISKPGFEDAFGCPIEDVYGAVIEDQVKKGLLISTNTHLYLTEHGTDISNYVMSEFLLSAVD